MVLLEIIIANIIIIAAIIVFNKLTLGICKCSKHLVGKVVIVTGGNAGIGLETAVDLAARGARVILACRNEARGEAARTRVAQRSGNPNVLYHQLDLASFASVRAFVAHIRATEPKIDILINNAGVAETDVKEVSEDGLPLIMQINHYGPFLLTNLLLPLLKAAAPSRIINVSSLAHRHGSIDFDDLKMEKTTAENFSCFKLYCTSKLCNNLMTVEMAHQLTGTGVTINCLHPGAVKTEIINNPRTKLSKIFKVLSLVFFRNAWEGAQTSIYMAVAPELSDVSGKYFSECREAYASAAAKDPVIARRLWEVSEKFVGLK